MLKTMQLDGIMIAENDENPVAAIAVLLALPKPKKLECSDCFAATKQGRTYTLQAPVTMALTGTEGGMLWILLCLCNETTSTLWKEDVLRMNPRVLNKVHIVCRSCFSD